MLNLNLKFSTRRKIFGFAIILPGLVGLIVFKIAPLIYSLIISFTNYTTTGGFQNFVGFSNYSYLFSDPLFYQSAKNTVIFGLTLTAIQVILALFYALLVTKDIIGQTFFRIAFFMPVVISMAITSMIWGILFSAEGGLFNSFLSVLNFSSQPFLTSSSQAMWALVAMVTWKGVGYWMIVFIAGIKGIPESLYEAAKIDGANVVQAFFRITLPLLKRVILFVTVADTAINFLIFAPVYLLTKGGPSGSTRLLSYYSYENAFIYGDMGYAAAISVSLIILTGLVIGLQFRFMSADFEY